MSPYANLPARAFWRTGVSEQHPLTIEGLYTKRFDIRPDDWVATAGSCFAQHVATHLRRNGFKVLDVEPAPDGLDDATAKSFGFNLYSARYGNLYFVRQLLQLARECLGRFTPQDIVWEKNGRFYDALRPAVEPNGLGSPEEVMAFRADHLRKVRALFVKMDVFVFTFGLTEGWVHTPSGTAYPTAPGTIAGEFDPAVHAYKSFNAGEVFEDFALFRRLIKSINPECRFLVTVSPVPLTATASGNHVLAATTYSKSVLRAAAGQLFETYDDIDYFPSYEIVTSPFSRGFFYEPNLRSINPAGVENVMRQFFSQHPPQSGGAPKSARRKSADADEAICEEALLEAFA